MAINVDMADGTQFELPKLEPDQMFPPQSAQSNEAPIKQKNNVFYQQLQSRQIHLDIQSGNNSQQVQKQALEMFKNEGKSQKNSETNLGKKPSENLTFYEQQPANAMSSDRTTRKSKKRNAMSLDSHRHR